MLHTRLYLLAILAIAAGCATHPAADHGAMAANAAEPDVQCHPVQITGSMLSKSVCTTKAERDAQQRNKDDLERIMQDQQGNNNPRTAPTVQ
jgi:hypothetical protein